MTEHDDARRTSPLPEDAEGYPGQGLGRPHDGPGSIPSLLRRLGGLCIDWGIAVALAWALLPYEWVNAGITGIWFLLTVLAVGFMGHSVGHVILGMQVQTLDGRPIGFAKAFVRTLLIALVIPALIMDRDQRGLNDRMIGTLLVRIR